VVGVVHLVWHQGRLKPADMHKWYGSDGLVGGKKRRGVGGVFIILSFSYSIVESVGSWNCGSSPTNGCLSLAATDDVGEFVAMQLVENLRKYLCGDGAWPFRS
jgi:hypothetical protein